ncbi:MAG: Nif3-like dinuclear metal center hexameric protein [Clostridia bacterium]|nr:Nif3-like dinuclear metal center hexameric protein [Clostridia bacterium]
MICNPTVKDVYDFIDSIAPFSAQCEWDNSGLIVGESDKAVRRIAVVLDITAEAVKRAVETNADLIVSHHPVIFRAVKSFTDNDLPYLLAKNGISAICAHTSLDIAKGGVNDALASALEFNATPFADDGELSMIRVAEINAISPQSLAEYCAEKLSTGVRLVDAGKEIRKVALCGGAGADFMSAVSEAGCDAYITGDVKHHEFLDAKDLGLTIIDAGHFETENPVVAVLAKKLDDNFDVEVKIIPQTSPISYYF